jgi:chemotaxis protein MotB
MFVYKNADREFLSGEGGGSFLGKNVGKEALDFGSRKTQEFNVFGEKAFSKTYDFSKLTNLEKELKEFAAIDLEPDKTLRIILTGDLLFPVGKTELMADSLNFLKKIAIFLKETPYKINVVGHTDNLPISTANIPSNWELSANRASAVARYLIAETKLPASQFYVTGHAEFLPVAPNTTSGGRAKNRRVEIVVTKEMPGALPLGSADL